MRKGVLGCTILVVLFLLPIFTQAFSVDRNLVPAEFYAAYRDASVGWRIEGSFSTNNDIDFFICDEGNYTRWERDQSAFLYEHSEATRGKTFNFTMPHDAVWYVVFSNVESVSTASLKAELFFKDLSDIEQTQVTWITRSTILNPAFIAFLFMIPVIGLLGIGIARKRESFPAVRYDEILPKPSSS